MSWDVMLLVLLGAALHASWNAVVKSSPDKFMDTVLVAAGAAVLAVVALPFLPVPAAPSWPYGVVSGILHLAYFALVAAAYRTGDMSVVYPLMRGTAPLIVAIVGAFFLGEHLSPGGWTGILLISGGVLGLALLSRRLPQAGIGPVAFALANAVVIASYTFSDALGARLSGHPVSYTLWILCLPALPLVLWAGLRQPRAFRAHLAQRWSLGLLGGACSLGAYALALWAVTKAPIATVAALRETSILFGVALAAFLLKERVGRERVAAAFAVAAGAVALKLA
ncbi:MAG TPA: DMT family transporter [Mesorhizobium sp.]|nr:DMT family transporter [Mesorhizobium sp.]